MRIRIRYDTFITNKQRQFTCSKASPTRFRPAATASHTNIALRLSMRLLCCVNKAPRLSKAESSSAWRYNAKSQARPAPAASLPSDQRRKRMILAACGAFALLSTTLGVWTTLRNRGTVTEVQTSVPVPGRNMLEKQINLAKIIGATATDASDEFVVAIPFSRPTLPRRSGSLEGTNHVFLSNASPLRPAKQDIVFGAGRCRIHGTVDWPNQTVLQGEATIDGIACALENGDS